MNPKIIGPIVILIATFVCVRILIATAPTVTFIEPARVIPTVRVIDATPRRLRHTVRSQGTVAPRTKADLVAEVGGRVVWISPHFAPGGYFEAGDPLVKLEARDYELARDRARASVQRARSEREFADAELTRQQGLSAGGVASTSQLANARRAATVAEADFLDARAALEQSQRDLERTDLRAPFAGRVRDIEVDIGQFVNRGATAARIYATDYAEIRLPIADDQLAFLNIEDSSPGAPISIGAARVRLTASFAGQPGEWLGRLIRTEGEIDQRSRMVHVVVRVEDPYGIKNATHNPLPTVPLTVGLFVQAEIEGPEVENIIVIPRDAMRNDSRILIVDKENHLHSREIEILRTDRDEVLFVGPLGEGERICVSPLQVVVEGMQVRTVSAPTLSEPLEAPAS
jgi:RND family efflux transporter MFP subunit